MIVFPVDLFFPNKSMDTNGSNCMKIGHISLELLVWKSSNFLNTQIELK